MSKAEEKANERYPLMQDSDEEGLEALKYVGMECDSIYEYNSIRYSQQAYFIEGYRQAEKDLELTWEDISKIISMDQQVCGAMGIADYTYNHQQAMEKVLKRFQEMKGKEV